MRNLYFSEWRKTAATRYLFFILPLGSTEVVGGVGRSENDEDSFGEPLSFFGFFAILLLRCSPLGMLYSWLGF
jgi:hypothetical protein